MARVPLLLEGNLTDGCTLEEALHFIHTSPMPISLLLNRNLQNYRAFLEGQSSNDNFYVRANFNLAATRDLETMPPLRGGPFMPIRKGDIFQIVNSLPDDTSGRQPQVAARSGSLLMSKH
ncbi:unnamed protein product [Protopolystoma xenopodis]|uniref:Uncharacterized protein n=1 Tax=Protopolystoma xenopodis TaxID=117903 RepID=A0A3S5BPA7_9PLAT|nr:unnamed protein product [Protopolystoma xenopodis]